MNAMTIQCTRCDAYLVLSQELLGRVQGKKGRVPCPGCGEKIRLDSRQEELVLLGARQAADLEIELDDAPSVRGAQLSLLPPAPEEGPAEEIDAVESVRLPVRTSAIPLPPSLRPRPSVHTALLPPRPVAGARRSAPPEAPQSPFDPLGSLAPVVPLQGVRLTEDGRLINRADEAKPKARSRMRTWAPLVAAAVFATGLASARVGSMLPLPLQRSEAPKVKQVAALVLESGPPVAALPAASAGSVVEPRFLAETAGEVLPVADAPHAVDPAPRATVDSPGETVAAPAVATDAPSADADTDPLGSGDAGASEQAASETPAGEATEPAAAEAAEADAEAAALPDFSKAAATVALQDAAAQALSCRQAGDPAGSARISVTFAPSGRATSANVNGAPYAGTATGGCIAARFRSASVPAFAGEHVTVTKTISIE